MSYDDIATVHDIDVLVFIFIKIQWLVFISSYILNNEVIKIVFSKEELMKSCDFYTFNYPFKVQIII